MKKTVTWILVADGAQAQVFEHGGPGKGLAAVKDLHFEEKHLKAQDIMADRPGRSFASAGPGTRSAMEYSSNPVEVREERFVRALADKLEVLRQQGRFDRLIIAAAPAALGDIRPALSDGVKDTVIAELPKDLTNIPQPQLDRHFDQLLA
jgi:protein required for attachment to host cells